MSSNYYTMRDAKVKIAHELMNRGWEVLGYHADESDSMTDYYSPAYWNGIATKNGFILVVDNSYAAESTPIKKYNYDGCLSHEDQEKINKLSALTVERGATAGEEANAKALIEKIKNNKSDVPEYEIVGYTTAHMANPGRCKWHIEKDNVIYDKGTGITKYSDVPDSYRFDINTMQFKDSYKYYSGWENGEYVRKENTLNDEELKAVKDLKALILRWERIVNSMSTMGDGTKETEEAGKEQQSNEKLIKVTEKVTKKVLKMVEVTDRKEIKVGDYLTFSYHGGYWKVTEEYMQKGTWKGVTESRKAFVYKIVGSASRGYKDLKNPKSYYDYEFRLTKSIEEGKIKIFELKEVEETQEVEKWVRQSTKKATATKTAKKEAENNETAKTKSSHNTDTTITATITLNEDKNGIEIRFSSKPDSEIRSSMKSNGFRWGGINNNCWYAKQSENTIKFANELVNSINNNSNDTNLHTDEEINNIADEAINNVEVTGEAEEVATETTNNNNYDPESIEEGYIYNCHFKAWKYSIDELHDKLTALNINYIDMGEKVGFENVDYFTMLLIQELNNENESILFIDSKIKDSAVTDEERQTVNTLLDYSVSIMEQLQLNHSNYAENQEYKTRLVAAIKQHDIKVTEGVLKHLVNEGYEKLEKVLKDLLHNVNFNSNNVNISHNTNIKTVQEVATDTVNYNDPEVIAWENSSNKYIPIEFNNIEIIETSDKNIFVNCLIPSLNKNCNIEENNKEIKDSSYLNKFLIQRIVKLSLKQYNYFINNLLHDYSFLTGLGGWEEDDKENLLYYFGVAIVCDGQETIVIDPECSSFAKYTCQLVEDINDSLQTELNNISTHININNNLFNDAMNSIVNDELYELEVSDKDVINDNRFIKNIPCNGLTVVTGYTIRELINQGIGIDILNLQPLKTNLELFKEGLRKHDNKQVFSLFPTESDKQLENIKFMERLEHELNRARIKEEVTKVS